MKRVNIMLLSTQINMWVIQGPKVSTYMISLVPCSNSTYTRISQETNDKVGLQWIVGTSKLEFRLLNFFSRITSNNNQPNHTFQEPW